MVIFFVFTKCTRTQRGPRARHTGLHSLQAHRWTGSGLGSAGIPCARASLVDRSKQCRYCFSRTDGGLCQEFTVDKVAEEDGRRSPTYLLNIYNFNAQPGGGAESPWGRTKSSLGRAKRREKKKKRKEESAARRRRHRYSHADALAERRRTDGRTDRLVGKYVCGSSPSSPSRTSGQKKKTIK